MTKCQDGHKVTPQDSQNGKIAAAQGFTEAQAHGAIPKQYTLTFSPGIMGAARVGNHQVTVNPDYAGCLNQRQIEAVMTHETYHAKVSTVSTLTMIPAVLLNAAFAYMTIRELYRRATSVFSKSKSNSRTEHPWLRVLGYCAAITVVGYFNAARQEAEENAANLYASKNMGSIEFVTSAIRATTKIRQPSSSVSLSDLAIAILPLSVAYGPVGMFHFSPSPAEQIKFLENHRPEVAKSNAIKINQEVSFK